MLGVAFWIMARGCTTCATCASRSRVRRCPPLAQRGFRKHALEEVREPLLLYRIRLDCKPPEHVCNNVMSEARHCPLTVWSV